MSVSPLQIDLPPPERLNAVAYLPWVIILVCAAALTVLINELATRIPAGLQARATAELQSAQFEGISVTADGRDLHLTGNIVIGQSPANLLNSLAAIEGVRIVRDDLTVVDPVQIAAERNRLFSRKLKSIDTASVAFRAGSVEFTDSAEPALQALFDLMLDHSGQRIRIEGHTDNTGPDSVNLRMSQDRASAVASYLVGRGIPADRLIVKGYGSSQPIDSNDTEDGRSKNRRIEISHVY